MWQDLKSLRDLKALSERSLLPPLSEPPLQRATSDGTMGDFDSLGTCDEAFLTPPFLMYKYKIKLCPQKGPHDWAICPYAHKGEKAVRRDPRLQAYSSQPCPDYQHHKRLASCPRGRDCPFAHGVFESWLHPDRYKTRWCKEGCACTRRVCFFAHHESELRMTSLQPTDLFADFNWPDNDFTMPEAFGPPQKVPHYQDQPKVDISRGLPAAPVSFNPPGLSDEMLSLHLHGAKEAGHINGHKAWQLGQYLDEPQTSSAHTLLPHLFPSTSQPHSQLRRRPSGSMSSDSSPDSHKSSATVNHTASMSHSLPAMSHAGHSRPMSHAGMMSHPTSNGLMSHATSNGLIPSGSYPSNQTLLGLPDYGRRSNHLGHFTHPLHPPVAQTGYIPHRPGLLADEVPKNLTANEVIALLQMCSLQNQAEAMA